MDNEPTQMSRRDFLKVSADLVATALSYNWIRNLARVTKDTWQPGIVHMGINFLENPKTVETTLKTSAGLLENIAIHDTRAEHAPNVKKNHTYKPISQIISEVIKVRQQAGKPVIYTRIHGYKDADYYFQEYRESIDDPKYRDKNKLYIGTGELPYLNYILGYKPGSLASAFLRPEHPIFPVEAIPIWEASVSSMNSSRDLLIPGSGFAKHAIEVLCPDSTYLIENSHYPDWRKYPGRDIDNVMRDWIHNIKSYVETKVAIKGGPVSAGVILDNFLEKNEGNIGMSLLDTMIFLKYMARMDTTLETINLIAFQPELYVLNEEWYQNNIFDEYGRVGNYAELSHRIYPYRGILPISDKLVSREIDQDLSKINQIGKAYHTWNLASMLPAFPPSIIQIGTAWRLYSTFSEQGPVKTAADFVTVIDLPKLEKELLKYSVDK